MDVVGPTLKLHDIRPRWMLVLIPPGTQTVHLLIDMLFLSPLFVAALSVALAAALPAANFKVKERVTAPRGWTDVGRAPADHLLSLRIGLPQPNFSELERHLYEVSDRKSDVVYMPHYH